MQVCLVFAFLNEAFFVQMLVVLHPCCGRCNRRLDISWGNEMTLFMTVPGNFMASGCKMGLGKELFYVNTQTGCLWISPVFKNRKLWLGLKPCGVSRPSAGHVFGQVQVACFRTCWFLDRVWSIFKIIGWTRLSGPSRLCKAVASPSQVIHCLGLFTVINDSERSFDLPAVTIGFHSASLFLTSLLCMPMTSPMFTSRRLDLWI